MYSFFARATVIFRLTPSRTRNNEWPTSRRLLQLFACWLPRQTSNLSSKFKILQQGLSLKKILDHSYENCTGFLLNKVSHTRSVVFVSMLSLEPPKLSFWPLANLHVCSCPSSAFIWWWQDISSYQSNNCLSRVSRKAHLKLSKDFKFDFLETRDSCCFDRTICRT